ncbi:hypothetical protein GQ53DRAFT_116896 [Thozetella sp. PMI_491]|nr:hypothetical protein GQ53DRAFT_116896 [Thozetella sp. PMI_491]
MAAGLTMLVPLVVSRTLEPPVDSRAVVSMLVVVPALVGNSFGFLASRGARPTLVPRETAKRGRNDGAPSNELTWMGNLSLAFRRIGDLACSCFSRCGRMDATEPKEERTADSLG